ncbi:hypothetical protein BGAL_0781g00010 [Botrytis galanthina]|uniref:Uncharacterized protein n=1 Tax=Botrytis galanthina TaxID=278940 RepID=A0A4S8QHI6_9HELO|nr:hypothetical protein BGAL_0781g00010 [Botrytis galanthina]
MPASIDPGKKLHQENIIKSIKAKYNSLNSTQRDQVVKEKFTELSKDIESSSEQLGCLVEFIETTGSLYELFPNENARILLQKCRASLVTGHEMEARLRNTEIDTIEATGTDLYGLFGVPGSTFVKNTYAVIRKILRAIETTFTATFDDGDDVSGRLWNIRRTSHVKTMIHDLLLQYRQLHQTLARDLTTNRGMNAFYEWLQIHPWWPNDKVLIRRKRPVTMGLSRKGKQVMGVEENQSSRHVKRRMIQHDSSISDTEVDAYVHGDAQDIYSDVSDVEYPRSKRDDTRVGIFSSPSPIVNNIDPRLWKKNAQGESTKTLDTEYTGLESCCDSKSSTSIGTNPSASANSSIESMNSITPELDHVEYATPIQGGRKRKGKCQGEEEGQRKENRGDTIDDESLDVGDEYEKNLDVRTSADDVSIEGGDEESVRRSIEVGTGDDSGDEVEDIIDSFEISIPSRKGQMDGETINPPKVVNVMDNGVKPIETQEESHGEGKVNELGNCMDGVEHRYRHRYGDEEENESNDASADMDITLHDPSQSESRGNEEHISPMVVRRECVAIPRIVRPRLSRKMKRRMKRVGVDQVGSDADTNREGEGEAGLGNTPKNDLNEQQEKQIFSEWSDGLIGCLKRKIEERSKVVERRMAELDIVKEGIKGASKEAGVFWRGGEDLDGDIIVGSCRSSGGGMAQVGHMKAWETIFSRIEIGNREWKGLKEEIEVGEMEIERLRGRVRDLERRVEGVLGWFE